MTYDEIMTGIHDAECKLDLSKHIFRIEVANDNDECGYGKKDWGEIYEFIRLRMGEFDARILH